MEEERHPPLITKSALIRISVISISLLLAGLYILKREGLIRKDDLIVFGICLPILIITAWLGLKLGFAAFRKKEAWAIRLFSFVVKAFVALSIIGLIIKFLNKG